VIHRELAGVPLIPLGGHLMSTCLVKIFKTIFLATLLTKSLLNVSLSQDLEEIVFNVTARYDFSMKRNVFAFDSMANKSFLI